MIGAILSGFLTIAATDAPTPVPMLNAKACSMEPAELDKLALLIATKAGEKPVSVTELPAGRIITFANEEHWTLVWTRQGETAGCVIAWGVFKSPEADTGL